MKYLPSVIAFCLAALIFGCSSEQTESLPISQDDLVSLLFDVHVAEGALSQQPGGNRKDSLATAYYDQVAKIHHISRADLDTCLVILQRNPELAKEVYEKVMEMMEKKRIAL